MAKGFWKIPEGNTRTPVAISKEQASALSEDTQGILVGEVSTQGSRQSSVSAILIRNTILL